MNPIKRFLLRRRLEKALRSVTMVCGGCGHRSGIEEAQTHVCPPGRANRRRAARARRKGALVIP